MATADTVLRHVREAVKSKKTESGERNAAARVLAKYGHFKLPKIEEGRDEGGATVRVYIWKNSPAGDFALVTGPSIDGEVHKLDSLQPKDAPSGGYVQMGASKLKASAKRQMERIAGRSAVKAKPTKPAKPKRKPRRAKPKPKTTPWLPPVSMPSPTPGPFQETFEEEEFEYEPVYTPPPAADDDAMMAKFAQLLKSVDLAAL